MNALYDIIGIPFGYLMRIIYGICKNYAISIIVFTIVTKLILFPVNYKTQKGAARMQLLNPKLEKLRKSYANNPQKLQEEQQKLYLQEGVNPMGSCLPMFIQMFLLFGILDVVYKPITHILGYAKNIREAAASIAGVQMNNLRSELIIMDKLKENAEDFKALASGDFFGKVSEFIDNFTIFGANLGKTPTMHPEVWDKEAVILCAIPFLACIAQLISTIYSQLHQKKVNPNLQSGGCMSVMLYGMSLLTIWFAFNVPAGVGFYWIWSSLFSLLITLSLNMYFTPERAVEIDKKEKEKARIYAEKHPEKKNFLQRVIEQQEALNQQQNGSARKPDGDKYSRAEMNKQNRERLNEARKRMAEKYGDSYDDGENDD